MAIEKLITHDGKFHADEVMSTAILQRLYPDAEIVRTRDAGVIYHGLGRDAVVYDVGCYYDPKLLAYDHHQADAPRRNDGTPYSALGLVWRHHGKDFLLDLGVEAGMIPAIHARFDAQIVLPIDQMDNGVIKGQALGPLRALSLLSMIDDFYPKLPLLMEGDPGEILSLSSATEEMSAFRRAVAFAKDRIEGRIASMVSDFRANLICKEQIHAQWGKPILELPIPLSAGAQIKREKADHVQLVVHPRRDDWVVVCLHSDHSPHEFRVSLPEAWGGLEGRRLAQISGIEDATFCHKHLFVAGARTRESALRMAEIAIDLAPAKILPEPEETP